MEWGYNRDREELPQINYGLVYAKETQLPLFYRLIPGSITDVATLAATSAMLMELGLKNFSYSLDRGYFSTAGLKGHCHLTFHLSEDILLFRYYFLHFITIGIQKK